MKLGGFLITAERWPGQRGYTWKGGVTAPLNQNGARFGGGWRFKLGISVGTTCVLIDLVFGTVRVTRLPKARAK